MVIKNLNEKLNKICDLQGSIKILSDLIMDLPDDQ